MAPSPWLDVARRALRLLRALLLVVAWQVIPAGAATEVDLELVLAVDVSLSMDAGEQKVQREGYVEAFRHPEIVSAISSGMLGRIAVTYIEWAGSGMQRVRVPWTLIDGAESALRFAEALEAVPYERVYRTSISSALLRAAASFETSGFASPRRVIDVSGDGPNNQGPPVVLARDAVVAKGIVVNGLPIITNPLNYDGFFDLAELDVYYEDCVIGGTGAFIVPVTDPAHFAGAIRRKIVMEIAAAAPRALPAAEVQRLPRIDCLIGEKMWESWRKRQFE
jgi:hypothetical protein